MFGPEVFYLLLNFFNHLFIEMSSFLEIIIIIVAYGHIVQPLHRTEIAWSFSRLSSVVCVTVAEQKQLLALLGLNFKLNFYANDVAGGIFWEG